MTNKPPKKSPKPAVSLSKVPSIKELLEPLGFQSAPIKDTDKFLESTRTFRKSYQGQAVNANVNLLQWNDPIVQSEYRNMAKLFLADDDNGDRYWGSKRFWYSTGLQYPDDSERIVTLLMQLFFKQTRYAFNNLQYGHKQTDAKDVPRDNTTPRSETLAQQRPTPSSSTVLSDSQDSRTSGRQTPEPQVIAGSEKMSPPKLPRGTVSGSRESNEASIYDGPDDVQLDFEEFIRRPFDILCADDQPTPPSTNPGPTSSTANPRKRKKQSIVEPRRSGRKPVPTYMPDVISNLDDYEAVFDSDSSQSAFYCRSSDNSERVAETTEMDYTFERDSSVEITNVSNRNVDPDGRAGGASSSGSAAKRPFRAPTAPMIPPYTASKTPLSKAKTSRNGSSSKTPEKAKSTTTNVPTSKIPASGSKIVKLSVPSTKAQAKPLGKIIEARKTSSERNAPTFQTSAPPEQRTEHVSGGVVEDSQNTPIAGQTTTGLVQATGDQVPSTPARDVSGTHSPRASGTSDKTLESEYEATERAVNLPKERDAQPYAMIPDDTSFSRTQLENPIASVPVTAPSSIIPSEPVNVPPQAAADFQPISPAQVSQPAPAPTVPAAAQTQSIKASPTPTPAPASAPTPKSKPPVPLWVITRDPHPTEELWDTGKLTGQTLPSFLLSLSLLTSRPAESVNKIMFTLRTPISNTKMSVGREAEDAWARLMETFRKKLREVGARGRSLSEECSILIEPVWEEVLGWGEGMEGEEDIEF
ncbi:hypothetical protein BKA64DRAFT_63542 [Cadophora sp. MPI-SDFR-AT-0126]|nr:hypothetical protein BKA64DRAFT_63542 [Leotiomycetes sp. MPI-SDFR-AT-0126]